GPPLLPSSPSDRVPTPPGPPLVQTLPPARHNMKGLPMTQLAKARTADKLLYTAKTHTVGGREHGAARSSDGNLEVKLSTPGSGRPGTNPEQLLAAGWSACFESALGIAALKRRIKLASDPVIDA